MRKMKQMNVNRIAAVLCMAAICTGCASSGTSAHNTSTTESIVETIAATQSASSQQDASPEETAAGSDAASPATGTPPTAAKDAAYEEDTDIAPAGVHPTAHDDIDVDLTMLSPTMVYAEVSNIMYNPLSYIGKTIQMNGEFALYLNEIDDLQYYACIITDATACCANGIEFVRAGDFSYPEDYPELGEEITVKGVFEIYEENGYKYIHLTDAEMTVP